MTVASDDANRFFLETVPAALRAVRHRLEPDGPWLSVEVEDAAYTLSVTGGQPDVRAGLEPQAWFHARVARAALGALFISLADEARAAARASASLPLPRLLAVRDALAQVHSTLGYAVSDGGREHLVLLRLDGRPPASTADATLHTEMSDHRAMTRGELLPHQALFSGRLRMSGDAGVPMLILQALSARPESA